MFNLNNNKMPAINTGYDTRFLNSAISLPQLSSKQKKDVATVDDSEENIVTYINYSVQLSASRGFPFFAASNIDGNLFKKAPRKDSWKTDPRVAKDNQWGPELYKAELSDFDKGHMTKREDVQWGDSIAIASKAAESTFFYTNAVPQHANLNQKVWRSLEDYILHTETVKNALRISVFTGPVLRDNDPFFVTPVNDKDVRIPVLFWKVVFFEKSDGLLYRAGFMMSQSSLLKENGIVEEDTAEAAVEDAELFMEFDKAGTYQVNISTIEKLSGLRFARAKETYEDDRKIDLILDEIDVEESLLESASMEMQLGFSIPGIRL